MTQEQIIEGNKVIAEFDGWYQDFNINKGSDINWLHKHKSTRLSDAILIPRKAEAFKYHSSWEWLMPVVEKIENSKILSDCGFSFKIDNWDTVIKCLRYGDIICSCSPAASELKYKSTSKIDAVFKSVIFFIKWYNTQKQVNHY